MKTCAVILILVLAACSQGEPLPPIQGPWTALNASYWTPTEDELKAIQALPER